MCFLSTNVLQQAWQVIRVCGAESYVDDAKIYLSFPLKDIEESLCQVKQDLHRVAEWSLLKPSPNKPRQDRIRVVWRQADTQQGPQCYRAVFRAESDPDYIV